MLFIITFPFYRLTIKGPSRKLQEELVLKGM